MDKDISPEVQKVMDGIQENIVKIYNQSIKHYQKPKVRWRNIKKAKNQENCIYIHVISGVVEY